MLMCSTRCYSLLLFTLLLAFVLPVQAQKTTKNLTLLNWADYMDPELIKKFETEFQTTVHTVTYGSDDSRTQLLLSTEGKQFDLAVIDGNSIDPYRRQGWLEPVSIKEIPNLKHLDLTWRQAYPGAESFAVPYFWGTTGIAYRKDLVQEPITSWMNIFKPGKELHDKILMLPQSRELIGIALKALGHSINTKDVEAHAQAKELLLGQKPYVQKYDVPAIKEGSSLLKGTVIAAATYSGDALTLQELDENIKYVTPIEGGVLWGDYIVVMSKGENKELAVSFINFLNEPENAAQLAEYVYYASPNKAAEKLLPRDFLEDETIYPPADILQRYEIEQPLPPRIFRLRNTIFSTVTKGKI